MSTSDKRTQIGSLLLVLSITFLVYSSVFSIPFLYYEEYGITQNSTVMNPAAFIQRMMTLRGFFGRPISTLSYLIDFQLAGPSPAFFHLMNLLIHCGNVVLFYFLATRLPLKNVLLPTLFFALHPLATACVSQIHGRPSSLSTFFLLAGLLLFMRWKESERLNGKNLTILFGLFLLMVLSKQTTVFFPLLLLWFEFHTTGSAFLNRVRAQLRSKSGLAVSALGLLIAVLLLRTYVWPNIGNAIVDPTTYSLSQFGNAFTLIKFYVLPFQTALVHDLYFHAGLDLDVFVGLLIFSGLVLFSARKRTTTSGFLLGAILISLFPTNSFIPKNEVIREWRLYPSLVFVCLLFGSFIDCSVETIRSKLSTPRFWTTLFYVTLVAYVSMEGYSVVRQNRVYTDEIKVWEQVSEKYPYSSDAMSNIGVIYGRRGDYPKALEYFLRAIQLDGTNYTYYLNVAAAYWRLGDREQNELFSRRGQEIAARYNERSHSFHLKR
ncbi:MAG: tetratricopeptide repeat protein [Pseudomonadota bacterium]